MVTTMLIDKKTQLRQALLVPCKDKKALSNWLRIYLGYHAFETLTSRFATATPLDAAWDLYNFCMKPEGKTPKTYLFAAARDTQKTITLAAIEVAVMLHARRNVLHFAGSQDQVDTAYAYMKQFFNKDFVRDLIDGDIKSSETIFLIPDNDLGVKLWLDGRTGKEIQKENPNAVRTVNAKVLPITPFTVQSKHEPMVSTDEIHTLKGEKAYAYKDIRKIPTASWDGKPWARAGISSRKAPDSLVEKEIAGAPKSGLIVKNWTVFEGLEMCPDSRSGTDFIHTRFVNVFTGVILTEQEYQKYDGHDKDKFSKTNFATGCLSCPLRSVCLSDLKTPKPHNKHLKSIESEIVNYLADEKDRGWYLAQCLSMQPSKEGIVFGQYENAVHGCSADEMYEVFMGEVPKTPQNLDSLIRLFRIKGLKCYMGLDWGFTDPLAIVILFTDGERAFVVYSFSKTGMEPAKDVVPLLKELAAKFGKFRIFPDTARPDNNKTLKGASFDVFDNFTKKIDTGVTAIRNFLCDKDGNQKIWFLNEHTVSQDPDIRLIQDEMKIYHYKRKNDGTLSDEIEDVDNHSIDSLRYVFLNLFAEGAGGVVMVDQEEKTQQATVVEGNINPFAHINLKNARRDDGGSDSSSGSGGGFNWDF